MIGKAFPGRGRVAVLRTAPQTALEDYGRLMRLAGYEEALPREHEVILKMNLSWPAWYPACSTTPWQLEGVIRTLRKDGYAGLIAVQNRSPRVDAYIGERQNKHKDIVDAYGLRNVHVYEGYVKWIRHDPRSPLLIVDELFPDGLKIPELFLGRNIIHLPTLRAHNTRGLSGAMNNALGGLLLGHEGKVQGVIHEVLVDILTLQKEIHPGVFSVMDGTLAGAGPGPSEMGWQERNLILASADPVAIDTVAAQLLGLDPLSIPFLRMAHEMGLGISDPREIEIAGYDLSAQEWSTRSHMVTAPTCHEISLPQKVGPGPLSFWRTYAEQLFHDMVWFPFVGRNKVKEALETPWGRHFSSYGDGEVVLPGMEPRTTAMIAGGSLLALLLLAGALKRLFLRRTSRQKAA